MNRPKQHHYIPKSYLEGFTSDDGRLQVYTRNQACPRVSIPKNVASQRNYYSVKKPDGQYDDRVEEFLANEIESPAIPAIAKLSKGYAIAPDEVKRVARYIAYQEGRTPSRREDMEDLPASVMTFMMQMMAHTPGAIEAKVEELKKQGKIDPGTSAEGLRKTILGDGIRIKAHSVWSLQALEQCETAVPFFTQFQWTIFSAPSTHYFMTSDHPVMKQDSAPDGTLYKFGLVSPL